MMPNCHVCQHDLPDGAQFCSNCGAPTAASHQSAPGREGPIDDAAPNADQGWTPDDAASTVVIPAAGQPQQPPPQSPPQPPAPSPPQPPAPAPHSSGPTQPAPPAAPPQYAPAPTFPAGQAPPPYVPPASPPGVPNYQPPGGPPPPGGPGQPQFVTPASDGSGGRSKGALVGVGLAVVGLLAVGFLAVRFITGGGTTGGASSPEDVVTEMVEALNAEDPLAAVSLLAPDELDGLDELVERFTEYAEELDLSEVLDESTEGDADETGSIDIDIRVDDVEVSMEGDDAAIVTFEVEGELEVTGDSQLLSEIDDPTTSFDRRDLEGALPNGSDAIDVIVVRLDGRWFASPMLTAGHYIVENGDLPSGDYAAIGDPDARDPGGSDAVGAVELLADVIEDPDVDSFAAVMGGGEGRALLAFRDALADGVDELNDADVRLTVDVDASDAGDGRVEVDELRVAATDGFEAIEFLIEDDCLRVDENGNRGEQNCISDLFDFDRIEEFDTRLLIDTVIEDGSHRVRLIPTVTDILGRFIGIVDDRQTLLSGLDLAVYDQASDVRPGTDIAIDFDGQLYTVHEFPVTAGETYHVSAAGDTVIDLWLDDGFGLFQQFDGRDFFSERGRVIQPFDDGVVRVVTYSEIDEQDDCLLFGCLATGEGSTTLRIRQAGRQSVDFPQQISGELGPGDVRVFDVTVDRFQAIRIDVGGAGVEWDIDAFPFDDVYELDAGTYELVVFNTSGDDSTSYTVTPSAAG